MPPALVSGAARVSCRPSWPFIVLKYSVEGEVEDTSRQVIGLSSSCEGGAYSDVDLLACRSRERIEESYEAERRVRPPVEGGKRKLLMVRACTLKLVISGLTSSSVSSAGAGWEASKTPRLPSLSPAKTRGLSEVGWKPREYWTKVRMGARGEI